MVDLQDNLLFYKDRSLSGLIFLLDVLEGIFIFGVCVWIFDDVILYVGFGSLFVLQDRNMGVVGDFGLDCDVLQMCGNMI